MRYLRYSIGEAAFKDGCIFKNDVRDPVGKVVFHIDKRGGVLTQGVSPRSVKDGLRGIFTLGKELADPAGDIVP